VDLLDPSVLFFSVMIDRFPLRACICNYGVV